MSQSPLLSYWKRALASPLGVILQITGSRSTFIQQLYRARAEAFDADLAFISIVNHPTDESKILLVRTSPEV